MQRFCLMALLLLALTFGCKSRNQQPREYRPIGGEHPEAVWEENREAAALIAKNHHNRAEEKLRTLLSRYESFGPAHNNLGLVYYHQNKLYLAAWEFEYAMKLMPNHAEPRNNLGLVYEKVGRLDEAIERYKQAYELESDNPQYIGNYTRAKVKRGDNDADTRKLLSDLVMRETRSEWRSWARERLVRMEVVVDGQIRSDASKPPPTTAPSEPAEAKPDAATSPATAPSTPTAPTADPGAAASPSVQSVPATAPAPVVQPTAQAPPVAEQQAPTGPSTQSVVPVDRAPDTQAAVEPQENEMPATESPAESQAASTQPNDSTPPAAHRFKTYFGPPAELAIPHGRRTPAPTPEDPAATQPVE